VKSVARKGAKSAKEQLVRRQERFPMITASELAGFFAAHAVWCLSDADSLTPMLAYTTEDGQRKMERLASEELQAAVEYGRQRLADNPMDANDGVLLYDGRIASPGGKLDAVLIEMRCYGFPRARATIAVPYSPRSTGRFRVHKPKLFEWEGCEDFDIDAAFEAFFSGVAAHEQGAKVWDAALDESK
jgi:hypothetical protein